MALAIFSALTKHFWSETANLSTLKLFIVSALIKFSSRKVFQVWARMSIDVRQREREREVHSEPST